MNSSESVDIATLRYSPRLLKPYHFSEELLSSNSVLSHCWFSICERNMLEHLQILPYARSFQKSTLHNFFLKGLLFKFYNNWRQGVPFDGNEVKRFFASNTLSARTEVAILKRDRLPCNWSASSNVSGSFHCPYLMNLKLIKPLLDRVGYSFLDIWCFLAKVKNTFSKPSISTGSKLQYKLISWRK